MTVTTLGSPVTAEAFMIASEPAPDQPPLLSHGTLIRSSRVRLLPAS
jgi:hypothetical protein